MSDITMFLFGIRLYVVVPLLVCSVFLYLGYIYLVDKKNTGCEMGIVM